MNREREIILSVKRSVFRVDDPNSEASNSEFKKVRESVLKRDNYTCQYCSLRAMKFQEIHHLDDNHANNEMNNLITTCSLCHMCNHIAFAGLNKMGQLIYLNPELNISQASLNAFMRQLWIAENSDDKDIKIAAQAYKSRIYQQIVPALRKLGDSKADMLGNFLAKKSNKEYEKRKEKLKGIYFLPNSDGFKKQLKYWLDVANKNFPSSKWAESSEVKIEKWLKNEYDLEPSKENIAKYIKTKEG